MELAKLKRKYLKLLKDYNKIVVQYNNLLKNVKELPIKEVKLDDYSSSKSKN